MSALVSGPEAGEEAAAFVAWSGGKDAYVAMQEAQRAGWDPRVLVTMLDEAGKRGRSHRLHLTVLEAQAEALGQQLVTRATTREAYEEDFREVLAELRDRGVRAGVFGDVELEAHRSWNERVCRAEGLRALHPLFGRPTGEVAEQVLSSGVQARVVVVEKGAVPRSVLGERYGQELLEVLAPEVDPLGEDGELHTVVEDAPAFSSGLELDRGDVVEEETRWTLDVRLS